MWLVLFFMKHMANKALTSQLPIGKAVRRYPEGTFISYCAVVNQLIYEYASEEVISEEASGINSMTQQGNHSALSFHKPYRIRLFDVDRYMTSID